MSNIPPDLRYTAEHEWVRVGGGQAHMGITFHAQEQLGDVVYVELPKVGAAVRAGQAMGVVESVKAASDIFSPLTGTVTAVNDLLGDHPELLNSDPFGQGWMVAIEPADPGELTTLLDAAAYEQLVAAG